MSDSNKDVPTKEIVIRESVSKKYDDILGSYGSTYNYTPTYKETYSTKTVELNEFVHADVTKWAGRNIFAFESYDGPLVRVICDGEKLYVGAEGEKEVRDFALGLFNLKYLRAFNRMVLFMEAVPFVCFATLISRAFSKHGSYIEEGTEPFLIFSDLYINGNWVNIDDLKEIFEKENLKTPHLLYAGKFDLKILEMLSGTTSELNRNRPINGLVVKPDIEDTDGSYKRLAFKITNYKAQIPPVDCDKVANDLVNNYLKNGAVDYWHELIKVEGIPPFPERKADILRLVVKDACDEIGKGLIHSNVLTKDKLNANYGKIIKQIKRILPGIVCKELKI
jgi:hypothetical protein